MSGRQNEEMVVEEPIVLGTDSNVSDVESDKQPVEPVREQEKQGSDGSNDESEEQPI